MCQRRIDVGGVLLLLIQGCEKLQIFTQGKIFIKMAGRRKQADLGSR